MDAYIDASVLKIARQYTPQISKLDWFYFNKGKEIAFNKTQCEININWQSGTYDKRVYWLRGNIVLDIKNRCCAVEFKQLDWSTTIPSKDSSASAKSNLKREWAPGNRHGEDIDPGFISPRRYIR